MFDLLTRRDLLRVGALGLAGSALPAAAAPAVTGPARADSVIFLWMAGGVTHIDSFDPKPDAPVEVRGILDVVPTATPGVQFCETIPRLAAISDQFALVRSFSHDSNDHLISQVHTLSGRRVQPAGLFTEPNIGSIVSKLHGQRGGLPAYIAVPGVTRPGPPPHNFFLGGWLGSQYAPYCLCGVPAQPDFAVGEKLYDPPSRWDEDWTPASLQLDQGGLSRLGERARLRDRLDDHLRRLERSEVMADAEAKHQGALRMLTSPSIRDAFDVSAESDATRDDYGRTKLGGRCLLARRLVEAGARFVVVDYGYDPDYGNVWDNHNAPVQNHPPLQEMVRRGYHLAGLDQAFSALLRDMGSRGLLERTLVVFVTEFGRTPLINKLGGRDHWGAAGSIFFAGAGARGGLVVGETDRTASKPVERGYTPGDIAATVYSALGINPQAFIPDFQGRPRPILEDSRPIPVF